MVNTPLGTALKLPKWFAMSGGLGISRGVVENKARFLPILVLAGGLDADDC